jgi:hypothetical protein
MLVVPYTGARWETFIYKSLLYASQYLNLPLPVNELLLLHVLLLLLLLLSCRDTPGPLMRHVQKGPRILRTYQHRRTLPSSACYWVHIYYQYISTLLPPTCKAALGNCMPQSSPTYDATNGQTMCHVCKTSETSVFTHAESDLHVITAGMHFLSTRVPTSPSIFPRYTYSASKSHPRPDTGVAVMLIFAQSCPGLC